MRLGRAFAITATGQGTRELYVPMPGVTLTGPGCPWPAGVGSGDLSWQLLAVSFGISHFCKRGEHPGYLRQDWEIGGISTSELCPPSPPSTWDTGEKPRTAAWHNVPGNHGA